MYMYISFFMHPFYRLCVQNNKPIPSVPTSFTCLAFPIPSKEPFVYVYVYNSCEYICMYAIIV